MSNKPNNVRHVDLHKGANLIYNEVKRKLEDTKTIMFLVFMVINVFLWGLFLAEARQTNIELRDLKDKYEVVQIYLAKVKENDSSSM